MYVWDMRKCCNGPIEKVQVALVNLQSQIRTRAQGVYIGR